MRVRGVVGRITLTACLVFVSFTARSADPGTLSGAVRNSSGDLLAGAHVLVTSPVLIEKQRTAVSDDNGRYHITVLPAGTYKATFTFDHPSDPKTKVVRVDCAVHENIVVAPGQRTTLDAVLKFCGEEKVTIIE